MIDSNLLVFKLFKSAKTGVILDGKKRNFQIPIQEDIFGQTPIDITLAIYPDPDEKSKLFDVKPQEFNDSTNLAALFFAMIKDYYLLHSGPLLKKAVIKAIER